MDVLFGDQTWPKPFHIVRATDLVDHGFDVAVAAQEVGTTGKRVERACRSPDLCAVGSPGGHIVAEVALRKGIRIESSQLCTGVQGRRVGHAFLAVDRSHPTSHVSSYTSSRRTTAHHDPHGARRFLIKTGQATQAISAPAAPVGDSGAAGGVGIPAIERHVHVGVGHTAPGGVP